VRKTQIANASTALRQLILAGEHYRQVVADHIGLGVTETQAVSHLTMEGDLGHSELAGLLGITTSAATSLVDRLEQHGVAERYHHPSDRRRSLVRLTERGHAVVLDSHRRLTDAFDEIPDEKIGDAVEILSALARGLGRQTALVSRERELATDG
jgi:DNA-binding MarR family transcriptional regulator